MTKYNTKIKQAEYCASQRLWDKALGLFSDICEQFPNQPYSFIRRGMILLASGRFAEANEIAEILMKDFPDIPEGLFIDRCVVANIAMGRKNWEEALRIFKEAAFLLPDQPHPVIRQGDIYLSLSQPDDINSIAKTIAEKFPDNPNQFLLPGRYLMKIEEWQDALTLFKQAWATFPENSYFITQQCLCLYHLGRNDQARSLIEKAFDGDCHFQLAYLSTLVDIIYQYESLEYLMDFYQLTTGDLPLDDPIWQQQIDLLHTSSQSGRLKDIQQELHRKHPDNIDSLYLQEKIHIKLQEYNLSCAIMTQIYVDFHQAEAALQHMAQLLSAYQAQAAFSYLQEMLADNNIKFKSFTRYDHIVFQRMECAALFEQYSRYMPDKTALSQEPIENLNVEPEDNNLCYCLFQMAHENIKYYLSILFPIKEPTQFFYKNSPGNLPINLSDDFKRFQLNTSKGLSEGFPPVRYLDSVYSNGKHKGLFNNKGDFIEISAYLNDSSLFNYSILKTGRPAKETILNAGYQYIEETVLYGGHFYVSSTQSTANYGHFIAGNLSRLWYLVKESFHGKIVVYFDREEGYLDDFMIEILSLLDIPEERIIIANNKKMHFKHVIVPYPTIAFTNHMYRGERELYKKVAQAGQKHPVSEAVAKLGEIKKLYLAYSGLESFFPKNHVPNRKIQNEEQLIEVLKANDFTVIHPLDYNEFEIHHIYNAANVIVLPESSALYGFIHLLEKPKIIMLETNNGSLFYAFFLELLGLKVNIYNKIINKIIDSTPQRAYAQGVYDIDMTAALNLLEDEGLIAQSSTL